MRRRDLTFTLALCGSLVLHAGAADALFDWYVKRVGHIYLPGYATASALPIEAADAPHDELGGPTNLGPALDSMAGDLPLQAPKALQTQAFLSLDPSGIHSSSSDTSALATEQPVRSAEQSSAAAQPFGVADESGEIARGQEQKQTPPSPAPTPRPQQQPSEAAPSGSPAEQSQTESDPVSTEATAEFRRGKTDVRFGRRHKITRPQLSLAAQADLMSLQTALLTLKITTDSTGHVSEVAIYRSSGSSNVDEAVKLAAYNWWFEPAAATDGKARGDVILFNIRFI